MSTVTTIATALYRIGGKAPGATCLSVTLNAAPGTNSVNGKGVLSEGSAPPLHTTTFVSGFAVAPQLPIVSPISQIITLTGYREPLSMPPGQPNVKCTITMSDDPAVGTASLQFRVADSGPWATLENLPVLRRELVAA